MLVSASAALCPPLCAVAFWPAQYVRPTCSAARLKYAIYQFKLLVDSETIQQIGTDDSDRHCSVGHREIGHDEVFGRLRLIEPEASTSVEAPPFLKLDPVVVTPASDSVSPAAAR